MANPMPNPGSACSECQGARYLRDDSLPIGHPRFGKLSPCPVCNIQTTEILSGLNEHERTVAFDRMKQFVGRPASARMIAAAKTFAANPVGFLSIHGGNGNGKTMCLMAIVNAVIASGIEARYMTAAQLVAMMRETFNSESKETDYDRVHQLASIPVLCIDEMDKLRDTPYSREIQQELINLRYRSAHELGTVLAWNGPLHASKDTEGGNPFPAVVSRIQEFVVISNYDVDIRPLLGGNQ
jgi:DNA replication protein DnaC